MARRTGTRRCLRLVSPISDGLEEKGPYAVGDGPGWPPEVEALIDVCRRILAELDSPWDATPGADACDSEGEHDTER
jgi:hypothetical protein